MFKIVCPKCLAKNYTENFQMVNQCSNCSYYFSLSDVATAADKKNGIFALREIGSWISNCFD